MTLTPDGAIDLPPFRPTAFDHGDIHGNIHGECGRLFVAYAAGTVEVVDCDAGTVCDTALTERGAHTTAFDQRRGLLHVFLPESCRDLVLKEDERR